MKKPQTIKINEATYLSGHKLLILFSDGKEQIVDFGPFLQKAAHPEIRKYLTPKSFKSFTLNDGDLMWGGFDLIFPIMDLYQNRLAAPDQKKPSRSLALENVKIGNF
jgi:hypothetical protein